MKYLLAGMGGGAAVSVILGFILNGNAFLFTVVVLGVLAFFPLIIKAFTSSKIPRPTIYGTSAPKRFTTVDTSVQQSKEKDGEGSMTKTTFSAGAGIVLLVVFFIGALIIL